jgi:hypothetical protein
MLSKLINLPIDLKRLLETGECFAATKLFEDRWRSRFGNIG